MHQSPPPATSSSPPSAHATRPRGLRRRASTNASRSCLTTDPSFYVTCLHSFRPVDPDQLPFRKGYVLEVVRTEENGWWAARRLSESSIGWIPSAFVKRISQEMALQQVIEGLRSPAKDSKPTSEFPMSPNNDDDILDGEILFKDVLSPTTIVTPRDFPTPVTPYSAHPFRLAAADKSSSSPRPRTSKHSSPIKSPYSARPATSDGRPTHFGSPLSAQQKGKAPLKAPLKLDTKGLVLPVPNLSPLTLEDALEFSPETHAKLQAFRFASPDTDSSLSQQSVRTPSHPFATKWAAASDDSMPSTSHSTESAEDFSSPHTSSPTSPVPKEVPLPRAGIDVPQRTRSATDPVIAGVPPSRNLLSTSAPSPLSRSRSKSAQAVTSPPRRPPVPRLMTDSLAAPAAAAPRGLSPRASAPDLKLTLGGEGATGGLARSQTARRRGGSSAKVMQRLGDDAARDFVEKRAARADAPWFLRPAAVEGRDIVLDSKDGVRAGTVSALIERLTFDTLIPAQADEYRDVFLKTLESFTTPDEVLAGLATHFYALPPPGLDADALAIWRERHLKPVQRRVLDVLRAWVPALRTSRDTALRVRKFLTGVHTPIEALAARKVLAVLDSPPPSLEPRPPSAGGAQRRRRGPITDLARVDPAHLAQQLTLLEARLYALVTPQECVRYSRGGKGDAVARLMAFCGTSDRIAAWVKQSVLEHDALHRRADTLQFWIRVAERCQAWNNVSSLTAIVAALNSVDLSRLQRTWAEVGGRRSLVAMDRVVDPNNNYAAARAVLTAVEGPCVPFIAMYLRDLLHAHEVAADSVPAPAGGSGSGGEGAPALVNFAKRRQTAALVDALLRHQARPYALPEDAPLLAFIGERMDAAGAKGSDAFWERSQELKKAEMQFSDIKRQMEWAGF